VRDSVDNKKTSTEHEFNINIIAKVVTMTPKVVTKLHQINESSCPTT